MVETAFVEMCILKVTCAVAGEDLQREFSGEMPFEGRPT